MRTAIFYPLFNSPGKSDATGAFIPEARKFAEHNDLLEPTFFGMDNRLSKAALRRSVFHAIGDDNLWEGKLQCVAFFCHGLNRSLQLGIGPREIKELGSELSVASWYTDLPLEVILYCCSTGGGELGGDGMFADRLRDAIWEAGGSAEVIAHTTAGHTTMNPYVRAFNTPAAVGGQYLVTPGSAHWKRWKRLLRTDFRFEFPFLTREEIISRLEELE